MNTLLIAAIVILVLIAAAALINSYKIYTRQVDSTLSTWMIILVASLMSLTTYLSSGNGDWVSGALNSADVISTSIITLTIILFGSRKWKLRSFEKFYFIGLVVVGLFWFLTSDAFTSNLLIQVIIALGYIPTVHTLIKGRVNTESFTVWGLIFAASIVSLYPSLIAFTSSGELLSLVYTLRSIVLLSLVLVLMWLFRKN
jgi:hypothetical protein